MSGTKWRYRLYIIAKIFCYFSIISCNSDCDVGCEFTSKNVGSGIFHYSDLIMSAMATKSPASRFFTQPFIQGQKTSKFRVTGLCAGNSPVTGEFPAYKGPETLKMFSFDDVVMSTDSCQINCDLVTKMTWQRVEIFQFQLILLYMLLRQIIESISFNQILGISLL